MRLDKELELTVGLKERTIGALSQHTKEHRCQPWNAASASTKLPLFGTDSTATYGLLAFLKSFYAPFVRSVP